MSTIVSLCARGYGLLLHLFPRPFQVKFREELQGDFESALEDARAVSGWAFLAVCLRELRDLPLNLLRTHLKRIHVPSFFNSPIVHFSGRGALAFGVSFVSVHFLNVLPQDTFSRFVSNHVSCFFYSSRCQATAGQVANILAWVIPSTIGGVLAAILFTGKNHFWKITGLAALAYLVSGTDFLLLSTLFGFSIWFTRVTEVLTGSILGMMMARVARTRGRKITLIAAGAVLYPLLVEIFSRLVWMWFPSTSPTIFLPAVVQRNVFLEFLFAGVPFGLLMGLILGWGRQGNKKAEDSI